MSWVYIKSEPGLWLEDVEKPRIGINDVLIRVHRTGICGTDVKLYKTPPNGKPVIMGHENIGFIAKAGREFTKRKGFKEGDLVFVEHYVMCGKCEWCHAGQYRHCDGVCLRCQGLSPDFDHAGEHVDGA